MLQNIVVPLFSCRSVVRHSGNESVSINEVTLRRARLVLGWVTVCSHPGQLILAIPPWVGAMSTSESWGVNGHTA